MKKLFAGLAIALMALGGHAMAQGLPAGTKVRIATEGAYKPWNFRDANGALVGFEIELVRLLCADLAIECSIKAHNWSSMLPQLDAGAFDAIFAGMSITSARKAQARFSKPYAATPAVFVTRKGSRTPNTEAKDIVLPPVTNFEQGAIVAIREAFLNAKIGVQKNTTHEIFLRDYIDGYGLVRTYERQDNLDADLIRGDLGAMIVSLGYAAPLVKGPQGAGLQIVAPRLSGGPFGEGIGAAFRKDAAALEAAFSGAIAKRIADGTMRNLALKWFGFDVSAKR